MAPNPTHTCFEKIWRKERGNQETRRICSIWRMGQEKAQESPPCIFDNLPKKVHKIPKKTCQYKCWSNFLERIIMHLCAHADAHADMVRQ